MALSSLLSATLGLSNPWCVTNVVFSSACKRLDITVDHVQVGNAFICPHCGKQASSADIETCTWFQKDFLNYETYLHARLPRVVCCKPNEKIIPPWTREGSKFVLV